MQETPDVQHATVVDDDTGGWRHVYWESGPQACVFTARMDESHHLTEIGGGRECGPDRGAGRCAFIGQGYTVFAASGGACPAFRVAGCSGIC